MKIIVTTVVLFLLFFSAVSLVATQENKPVVSQQIYPGELPPPILLPSDYAIDRSKEMGAEVFKLVPIVPYQPALNWLNGGYSKGLLGEGSFVRVDLGSGKSELRKRLYFPPSIQITLLRGDLKVGGGFDYGFFMDLGQRDLRTVAKTIPEAEYFLSYQAPKLESEIRDEIEKLKNLKVAGVTLESTVPVKLGHTYLLRSIRFDWSDILVVFNIVETFPDGSVTILWKKLAEFEMPRKLVMPDSELQKKVDDALANLGIEDLRVTVRNNILVLIGLDAEKSFSRLKVELGRRGISYFGIDFSKMRRTPADRLK
jgi:hypothetical protein